MSVRVVLMHRTEPKWEAGVRPSPELIAGMGRLLGEMDADGVLLGAGGLRASAHGVRLRFADGKRTVTPGPFVGSNELPAGFAIVRVTSIDDAVAWATRFAGIVGDVEIDIRPVTEPWDLGLMDKPAGETTTRFMLVHKADADSESGAPRSPARVAELAALTDEMVKAGVLQAAERLEPSSAGKRLRFQAGKRTVLDGPFAESKELIAGYVMLRVPSKETAVEWAARFAAVAGDVAIDVRPLSDPADSWR